MSDTRIILFTGKGGVGKTTVAAASALRSSEKGHKTLLMSSDPAHSLGDALDHKLGPEPQSVSENLDALEIDLFYSMRKYWGNIRSLLLAVLKRQGIEQTAAEELAAIPGMEEGSVLLWLDMFYHEYDYDTIIIDSAPTGETLTLLSLPQVSRWWLTKAFPLQKLAFRSVGKAIRFATGVPMDKAYNELDAMFDKLNRIQEVLADPEISSMRLVMNPERMVVQESRRAYTYLQLYGFTVDSVIVNRIIDPEKAGEFFKAYVESQQEYLDEIENSFGGLPVFKMPHMGKEVFGLEALSSVGNQLYNGEDPSQVFNDSPTYEVEQEGDDYILNMYVPFLDEEEYTVQQFGDQLVLQIKNQRRNIFLPNFLNYYELEETSLEDNWLRVYFEKPEEE